MSTQPYGAYPVHPAADWFPMMSDERLRELADSIHKYGQDTPVVVWNGQLLDGRNRWRACELAGLSPRVVEMHFDSDESAVDWIMRQNFHRRDNTPTQRATVVALHREYFETRARARQAATQVVGREAGGEPRREPSVRPHGATPKEESGGRWESEAAKAANVGTNTVRRVANAIKQDPSLAPKLMSGEISAREAERLTTPKQEAPAPKTIDKNGAEVPEHLRSLFQNSRVTASGVVKCIEQAKALVEADESVHLEPIVRKLDDFIASFRLNLPSIVCDRCHGDGCKWCSDRGWHREEFRRNAAREKAAAK